MYDENQESGEWDTIIDDGDYDLLDDADCWLFDHRKGLTAEQLDFLQHDDEDGYFI
tara:strand:- start:378 stop:545 length:168 start_codon:yes stop_codon:yes gene_type:complete